MTCFSCMHWRRPTASRDDRGRVQEGLCQVDGRPSHPQYNCVDHEDFASTEGRRGLTMIEVLWLRANRATDNEAANLISLYNMIVAQPRDPGAKAIFAETLKGWRRDRPPGVLATHSKRGAPTGNRAGGTEESTHATHQHSG